MLYVVDVAVAAESTPLILVVVRILLKSKRGLDLHDFMI
jgi:hypothetical protein